MKMSEARLTEAVEIETGNGYKLAVDVDGAVFHGHVNSGYTEVGQLGLNEFNAITIKLNEVFNWSYTGLKNLSDLLVVAGAKVVRS
jgi:hypothetical protein